MESGYNFYSLKNQVIREHYMNSYVTTRIDIPLRQL